MIRTFRLALAQMNPTVGDIDGNTARIIEYVERARESQADLVAFPELAITGYPPEDLLFKTSFLQANEEAMRRVVEAARDIAVVVGYVEVGDSATGTDIANAAAIGYNGKLIDSYRKMYLPNYGVFDEDRYFRRGTECPVYRINGVGIGVNICEDIWYPVGPIAVQREAGAELIVNINGSPFHAGKTAYREKMIGTRAADNGLFVAYLNMVGGQDELVFDGASLVCDMSGEVIARGPAFAEDLLVIDLDIEAVFRSRLRTPLARKENPTILREVGEARTAPVSDYNATVDRPALGICLGHGPGDGAGGGGLSRPGNGHPGLHSQERLFPGPGGPVRRHRLGPDRHGGRRRPGARERGGGHHALPLFLRGQCQRFQENWPTTWALTAGWCPLNRPTWLSPICWSLTLRAPLANVAEENVQARIRGNVLMTISNKFGWIVLTTGNKSEMAMGYATLYGDMAGGFAVIKDVPKTLVYELMPLAQPEGFRPERGQSPPYPMPSLTSPPAPNCARTSWMPTRCRPTSELDPIVKGLCGRGLQLRGNGGNGPRCGGGAPGDNLRGPQRVQAPPGPARSEDNAPGLRQGPPVAHSQPLPAGVGEGNLSSGVAPAAAKTRGYSALVAPPVPGFALVPSGFPLPPVADPP